MLPGPGKGPFAGLTFDGRDKGHEQETESSSSMKGKAAEAQALRGDKKPCKETVYFERILQ